MLHIHLYRARKRYRLLVAAITQEMRRPSDVRRLDDLRRRKDAARDQAAAIERAMQGAT